MNNFDVLTWLEDKDIEYATAGKNISAGWVGLKCPACHDMTNHLGINIASGNFSCFRCGIRGNPIKLVMMMENCDYQTARYTIDDYPLTAPIKHTERVTSVTVELPAKAKKPLPRIHQEYLENRNFDPELLTQKYDLYGVELAKEYQYRLIIPVYFKKQIVTFTARAVVEADMKYKTCPIEKSIVSIKDTLYNVDRMKDTVVLVEGIFDAWRIGDSACATFGTKVTSVQINLLKKCKNVFILFDSDAKKHAENIAKNLSGLVDHVEIITLTEGDPADLSDKDAMHLRKMLFL